MWAWWQCAHGLWFFLAMRVGVFAFPESLLNEGVHRTPAVAEHLAHREITSRSGPSLALRFCNWTLKFPRPSPMPERISSREAAHEWALGSWPPCNCPLLFNFSSKHALGRKMGRCGRIPADSGKELPERDLGNKDKGSFAEY